MTTAPSMLPLTIGPDARADEPGLSPHRSPSGRHPDSIVYGDEFLSPKELNLPFPRETLHIFSAGASAKGPLFNRNTPIEHVAPPCLVLVIDDNLYGLRVALIYIRRISP